MDELGSDTDFSGLASQRVERRRQEPEFVRTYDRDGDGRLDDSELEEARRAVELELRTEARRTNAGDSRGLTYGVGEVLRDRFEIVKLLGRGGQGTTWLAVDRESGSKVAVKQLDLEQTDDWKAVERFEREIDAYKRIDDPAIPGFIDALRGSEKDRGLQHFYLVREFVAGEDLEQRIDRGEAFSEEDARALAEEVLRILEYLHTLDPPIIHRDIKPSNILLDADSYLHLVDFGAVHTVLEDEAGGSTLVGTAGYMPVEQMMGRAVPPTDLYALGATLVRMLTRRELVDLPMERMRLGYHEYVNISEPLESFIDRLVAPYPDDRYPSAAEAREALGGGSTSLPTLVDGQFEEAPNADYMPLAIGRNKRELLGAVRAFRNGTSLEPPEGSTLRLEKDGETLVFEAPLGTKAKLAASVFGQTKKIGIGVVLLYVSSLHALNVFVPGLPFIVALGGLGMLGWSGYRIRLGLQNDENRVRVELNASTIRCRREIPGGSPDEEVLTLTSPNVDLGSTDLFGSNKPPARAKPTLWCIEILDRDGKMTLGEGLRPAETIWMASEIRDFLEDDEQSPDSSSD